MSTFLCSLRAFARRREDKLSPEAKEKLHTKMVDLASQWDSGGRFENVQKAGWNNAETFEWLWEKYTKKSLDPSQNPPNLKDVKKFEFGLDAYNKLIAKKDGAIWSKFHLPRAAMQNIPELKKFETELIQETSFFRDYTTATNKQINEFLTNFKDLGLSLGEKIKNVPVIKNFSSAGQKAIRNLNNKRNLLEKQISKTDNLINKRKLIGELNDTQQQLKRFYENGSGRAYKIINSVLQGADIESITVDGINLTAAQKNNLYNVKRNMTEIRKSGVTGLIRGLQKIKQTAKDKNLDWVDGTIDRINGMIRSIEFQSGVDRQGRTIKYKDMIGDKELLALGFKSTDKDIKFSPHYMSKYTLGIVNDVVRNLETAVDRSDLRLDDKLNLELNRYGEIITDVAKHRSPIIDKYYDNDPYFFLKKYANDVGIFNYKTHVHSTFKKAVDTITNEHLKPAEAANRKDLVESATSMLDLVNDVKGELQHIDPRTDKFMSDSMRLLTSVTYFRLMGGNIRSAARNATQRLYEFVQFGYKANHDARQWYKNSGTSEDNLSRLIRQQKKRGIQWYDGKSKTSSVLAKDESGSLSEQSRGALEDAYMMDKDLYVDKKGELQIKEQGENILEKAANFSSRSAVLTGKAHKIVEDWNRSSTFKNAFALAFQNLEASDKTWLARRVLGRSAVRKLMAENGEGYSVGYDDIIQKYGDKHEKVVADWIENEAGQIAYNATIDLHFEYSKWAKAKAIKVRGDENQATQFAKAGLGQFAHYRFNMVNLMYNIVKDAGVSIFKAKDFTSEETFRLVRMGTLLPMISAISIVARTDFKQLANNDVEQTAKQMYAWLSSKKEQYETGEISKETQEWVDDLTYGQGFGTFLGPNYPLVAGAYELLTHASMQGHQDPRHEWKNKIFEESVKKAINKNDNKEDYDLLAYFNSQIARSYSYTTSAWKSGGLKDAIWLELGFFPTKEQREASQRLYRTGKKKKKFIKTGRLSESQRRKALDAMSAIGI